MRTSCDLTEAKKIRAFYFNESVIIHALVVKHSDCEIFSIVRSLLDVEPPAFTIQKCTEGICNDRWLNEEKNLAQIFYIGVYRESIHVSHSGGTETIKVKRISIDLKTFGGLPEPFIKITNNFEEDPQVIKRTQSSTSKGYSNTFSLEEALKDAIKNLKFKNPNPNFPDELITIVVKKIGILYGGFVGFNGTLFVDIEA